MGTNKMQEFEYHYPLKSQDDGKHRIEEMQEGNVCTTIEYEWVDNDWQPTEKCVKETKPYSYPFICETRYIYNAVTQQYIPTTQITKASPRDDVEFELDYVFEDMDEDGNIDWKCVMQIVSEKENGKIVKRTSTKPENE